MTVEEDDDRPPRNYADLFPILLAAILTGAAFALYFFQFNVPPSQPDTAPAANHGEVSIGIGEGSTIHQPQPLDIKQPSATHP